MTETTPAPSPRQQLAARIAAAQEAEAAQRDALAKAAADAADAQRALALIDIEESLVPLEAVLSHLGYQVSVKREGAMFELTATAPHVAPIRVTANSRPIGLVKLIGTLITNRFPSEPR